jgi:HEAT repeat protein
LIKRLQAGHDDDLPLDMIMEALGKLRSREAVPLLCEVAVQSPDDQNRIAAAEALREIGCFDQSVGLLLKNLKSDDALTLHRGVTVLRVIAADPAGGREVMRQALEAMPTASISVRLNLVTLFSGSRSRDAETLLLRCLADDSPQIRAAGIHTLTGIGVGPAVTDRLIACLKSPAEDRAVIRESAYALGRLKRSEAVSSLIGRLNDSDEDVRSASLWALRNITGKSYGRDISRWQLWMKDQLKNSELEYRILVEHFASATKKRPSILEDLPKLVLLRQKVTAFALAQLTHADFRVRAAACNVLAQTGTFEVIPPLIERLRDGSKEVSFGAWRALKVLTGQRLPNRYSDWQKWYQDQSL